MNRRLLLVVLLPAALAACGGTKGATGSGGGSGDGDAVRSARPVAPAADPLDSLPASGPVARYRGAFAREPALLAFQREAPILVETSIVRLRDETGLQFTEGRLPEVAVSDAADVPASGRASLRLVNGVRRPQIDVRAASVASGEFRAKEHLPALVAEAAVLAASPERAPPPWVLRGLPLVFSGGVERRASELLLGGAAVRIDVAALAPLEPAFRVAALQRIGVGERVLARFLDARLGGDGDSSALREVGVGSMDFLDAAAATEADRTLDRVLEDDRVRALRDVRASLTAGDVAGAEAAISRIPGASAESPWVDAEVRLVRAETSLLRGDDSAAIASLDDVMRRPDAALRLRDARFLRALAALRTDDPAARVRAAEFARTCIDDPRTAAILSDLGVSTQDAFDLVTGDAAARAKAASRIGERGAASALPFVSGALRDGDAGVRRAVATTLGRLGTAGASKSAAADADAACSDSDAGVRSAAVAALAQIDASRGLARARDLVGDPDESVRRAAAAVVSKLAPKPAEPAKPATVKSGASAPADPKAGASTSPAATTKPAAGNAGALVPPDDVPPPPAPRAKAPDAVAPRPSVPEPAKSGAAPTEPAPPAPPAPKKADVVPPAPRKPDTAPPQPRPAPPPPPAPAPTAPPRRTDPPPRPVAPPATPPKPPAPVPAPEKTPVPLPPPSRETR